MKKKDLPKYVIKEEGYINEAMKKKYEEIIAKKKTKKEDK